MISITDDPQFSAEDILEIPDGIGRTICEFEKNLLAVCPSLFHSYGGNDVLAKDLLRAKVIGKGDRDLSTTDAVSIRFRSRKLALSFIHRLNGYMRRRLQRRKAPPAG